MHRALGVLTLVAVLLSGVIPVASAQAETACGSGQTPHYVFGFADLHDRLGDWMGSAVTCEFPDPNATGDVHQRTTQGLAFWRKSTNTPTFTNGAEHWALSGGGFVYWQGTSIDPPSNAIAAAPNALSTSTPRGVDQALAGSPASPPTRVAQTSAPPPTPTPGATYTTHNGPKTAAELRDELTAAGYGGPWDVGAMLAAYDHAASAYVFPVIPAPTEHSGNRLACLNANISCSRDAWWIEYNELQDSSLVQYAFLGPGLITERRFIEVVWLLWDWPEGRTLLEQASKNQVSIISAVGGADAGAFAYYRPASNVVMVNRTFAWTSTWMIADVIAHELKHAADWGAGILTGNSSTDCVAREQRGYEVEWRYQRWLSERFGLLPVEDQILAARLSQEDYQLYLNLYRLGSSSNVDSLAAEDYRNICRP